MATATGSFIFTLLDDAEDDDAVLVGVGITVAVGRGELAEDDDVTIVVFWAVQVALKFVASHGNLPEP